MPSALTEIFMMNPQQNNVNGYRPSQFDDRFLSSFSQSMVDLYGEPTPKKPKLDIAKNGNLPKTSTSVINSVNNKKETIDDVWGNELDLDEFDVDEVVALSQMTHFTQSNMGTTAVQVNQKVVTKLPQESNYKKNFTPAIKNSPKVPLRRVSSSQWPSSSHTNNLIVNGKGPGSAAFLPNDSSQKLELEIRRMKEELNKKTGEARILRDKVSSTEKEKDKIRREYSSKIETLNAEAERNSSGLVKKIKSLQGQLDVKNMELKSAERKLRSFSVNRPQPDSPNRFGSSSRTPQSDTSPEQELARRLMIAKAQGLPLKFLRESLIPELLEPSQPEAPVVESAQSSNPRLFPGVLETGGGNAPQLKSVANRTESLASHTSISSCAALLLSPSLVDITSDCAQQAISQMVDVCHKVLLELLRQLESASSSNNRLTERERELLMSGSRQLPLDREYDLASHRELYRDERGIPARRALGFMSTLLQTSNFTAKRILSSKQNESTDVLDTLRNIVQQIEKQRRTLMFQGVLAGSVVLIENLLKSETAVPKETQSVMVDVLRWVVSARPGCLVIRNILQALLAAERYPHIIHSLCHNSANKTYKENTRHSIIQFTPDSCILQVLCSLLKAADTPRKHMLTDPLTRWVLSLFCGGRTPPRWLTAVPTAQSCLCHSLVCKLCFSLLSEACLTYPTVDEDDRQLVEKVLTRGVLLISLFMNEDEHLLAIVDPHSLGCYEHFLHFMSEAKITLNSITRELLAFLCEQEEMLKQPGNSANKEENTQLQQSLAQLQRTLISFTIRDNGQNRSSVLDGLQSL